MKILGWSIKVNEYKSVKFIHIFKGHKNVYTIQIGKRSNAPFFVHDKNLKVYNFLMYRIGVTRKK